MKGSKTIRIKTTKAEKRGFTVPLASTAAGEKLPAVIIIIQGAKRTSGRKNTKEADYPIRCDR